MKMICPYCESRFSLEEAARDTSHAEIAMLASKFGPGWQFAQGYVDCFRQAQYGRIRLEKRLILLNEVWAMIAQERFDLKGAAYRTSMQAMKTAMYKVINLDKWGLKNHNYLKQVLISDGAERLSAEGLTAVEETAREEKRRIGHRPTQTDTDKAEKSATMTAEEYKRSKGIGSLLETGNSKLETGESPHE